MTDEEHSHEHGEHNEHIHAQGEDEHGHSYGNGDAHDDSEHKCACADGSEGHSTGHGEGHDHDHAPGEGCKCARTASETLDSSHQEGLVLSGLDCADCALQLERVLRGQDGVASATVSFAASKMNVRFDPDMITLTDIEKQITSLGYGVTAEHGPVSRSRIRISGMDCTECAETVRKAVALMPGVFRSEVDFASATMNVEHDRSHAPIGRIVDTVESAGYEAVPVGVDAGSLRSHLPRRKTILTATSGAFLLAGVIAEYLDAPSIMAIPLFLVAMATAGLYPARSALTSLRTRSLDMNFLMTVAAIGAGAIGEWAEGATVLFLYSLGNLLQSYSLDRTRSAIQQLMSLAPEEATVIRGGQELRVPVNEVLVGEKVLVRPGERVPIDGQVIRGASSVDEAAITGEPIPADKTVGSQVYAGTQNADGMLEVTASESAEDSAISRIVRLVEEAQSSKAPSQLFIDRFARYYTPVVVGIALALAVIPILLGGDPSTWVYRALALLIIACPCALVISTPVSLVSAIGAATRQGVLIKDGAALESLGRVSAIAFDKTGTLTRGRPNVESIKAFDSVTESELLRLAASAESGSPHPLARALVRFAHARRVGLVAPETVAIAQGQGVTATVDGSEVVVGKANLITSVYPQVSIPVALEEQAVSKGQTPIFVATEGRLIGILALADTPRPETRAAVSELKGLGLRRLMVLSGDNVRSVEDAANRVGLDEIHAELLPQDKVDRIARLQREGHVVAVVGDGVNDAPALALSDVGIAMGAIGSDITLETADVALLSDDLSKLPYAVHLGRRTLAVIKQNIWVSIGVKVVFLALAPIGLITLWLAVLADTGIALLVTANGMRLFKIRATRKLPAPEELARPLPHAA